MNAELEKKWKYLMDESMELLVFFDETGCVVQGNKKAEQELGYGEALKGMYVRFFKKH